MPARDGPAPPGAGAPHPRPEVPGGAGRRGEELAAEGDRLVYEGDLAGAKVRYGQAIDAYLDAGRFDEAIRACRRLIRVAPDVVRTHFTLAFLLIGRQRFPEAEAALTEYAAAVRRRGAESYAIPRLNLLAHSFADPGLRTTIGRILQELGAMREGERMLSEPHLPLEAEWSTPQEWRERWEVLLQVALRSE